MLDWEENIFVGLKALYRQAFVRPEEKRRAQVRVTLKERRASLLLLADMLAGRGVGIFETDHPALCGGERIFLPAELSLAPTREANADLYELKTILAALALREGWHRNGVPLEGLVGRCRAEFPRLEERLEALRSTLPPGLSLWQVLGDLPALQSAGRDVVPMAVPPRPTREDEDASISTEVEGQGQAEVKVVPGRDGDGKGADLPTHTFEKVETLEEYTGQSRKSDGEDELEEHAEALSELKMTQVMRSAERPRSIYRGELILDGLSLEVDDGKAAAGGVAYPEWDFKNQRYRPDWCRVLESRVSNSDPAWLQQVQTANRPLVHRLKRQFHTLTSDWLRLRRQPAGGEFDLDAVIDSEVERRTGHTPTENVYLHRRRNLHDVAALVLLDISYSTDAWLANRRVLDIITQTVFCVGEVLEDYVERFAIAAFTSNTRQCCPFEVVKPFREPWATARGRLGSLDPRGYTRIGPALRHAHELLLNEPASRKIVLLVTDGRPCDYDRYEGLYGIKDVKKAIEVGRQNGIQTHAFAVEQQAAEAFPQMFTRQHYDILRNQDALAHTMCRIFARLLAD